MEHGSPSEHLFPTRSPHEQQEILGRCEVPRRSPAGAVLSVFAAVVGYLFTCGVSQSDNQSPCPSP